MFENCPIYLSISSRQKCGARFNHLNFSPKSISWSWIEEGSLLLITCNFGFWGSDSQDDDPIRSFQHSVYSQSINSLYTLTVHPQAPASLFHPPPPPSHTRRQYPLPQRNSRRLPHPFWYLRKSFKTNTKKRYLGLRVQQNRFSGALPHHFCGF